jgi:2-keto-4-pentenoate hydratase
MRPFSQALLAAHIHAAPSTCDLAAAPTDVETAYAIQQEVLAALAQERPIAWKVSPPRAGAAPHASPVPPQGVFASPAVIRPPESGLLGIECEIAFRFLSAPASGAAREELAAITEAVVLIELCATRFADFDAAPPLARLADFQSHAAFVVGTGIRDWSDLDFAGQPVSLHVRGRSVMETYGSHPTRDLAAMLAWGVGHCTARGMPLQAGDVVTTGSWTGVTPLHPGEEAVARFAGIGEARLALD